ncbi:ORF53 [macacine gammaherpesvirus 12]|uniref:ORF53 n=1 Tax=macacine gammaherpesvirus 12 TaxID=2560571 RepID=A0A0B5CYV6_9GAMA|nr:ORF53 [Macaca nemestrina rhadinovirus 2]AJE29700.1 ORF53 [Macaca nemestrina rhadinovirus 2]
MTGSVLLTLALPAFLYLCLPVCATVTTPLTTGTGTPPTSTTPSFYDYDCSADTYQPMLSSFSSIWAVINSVLVAIATFLYLTYMCFFKFVETVAHK